MISFYSFAESIEAYFGVIPLAVIYFGSIIASSAFALAVNRGRNYRALGASGGVCGVIFGSLFLLDGGSIIVFPIPIPIPAFIYAFMFIAVSVFAMGRAGNISHEAHIGGAVSGMLITAALYPTVIFINPLMFFGIFAFCGLLWFLAPKIFIRMKK